MWVLDNINGEKPRSPGISYTQQTETAEVSYRVHLHGRNEDFETSGKGENLTLPPPQPPPPFPISICGSLLSLTNPLSQNGVQVREGVTFIVVRDGRPP